MSDRFCEKLLDLALVAGLAGWGIMMLALLIPQRSAGMEAAVLITFGLWGLALLLMLVGGIPLVWRWLRDDTR